VQAALDRLDELVVGRRLALEDQGRPHVHVRRVALEVQERRIEAGQPVRVGHAAILRARRASG
jgi:hypothetical protein